MMRTAVGLFLCLLHFPVQGWAACNYLPDTPAPDWLNKLASTSDFYSGTGAVAITEKNPFNLAEEQARVQALKSLLESISVTVKTDTRLQTVSQLNAEGKAQSIQHYNSVIETATNRAITGATVAGRWLNRRSCTLWVLMQAPAAEVARQTRLLASEQSYQLLIGFAQQQHALQLNDIQARSGVAKAKTALSLTEFSLLPNVEGYAYWQERINEWQQTLESAQVEAQAIDSALAQWRQAFERWNLTTSEQKAENEKQLEQLAQNFLSQYPPGREFSDAGEKMALLLGDLYAQSGNACKALQWLKRLHSQPHYQGVNDDIQQRLGKLSCDRGQQSLSILQTHFDKTQSIELSCTIQQANDKIVWTKACAEWFKVLQQAGFRVRFQETQNEAMRAIGVVPLIQSDNTVVNQRVVVEAKGDIESRDNPDNPMGKDYRFKGAISVRHFFGEKIRFVDQYNGIGGWNPVSGDMAKDVLALTAIKRWKEKLAAQGNTP